MELEIFWLSLKQEVLQVLPNVCMLHSQHLVNN